MGLGDELAGGEPSVCSRRRSFSSLGGLGTLPVSIRERYGLEIPVRPASLVERESQPAALAPELRAYCFHSGSLEQVNSSHIASATMESK